MLLNDWDRGPSQWKWARFDKGAESPWEPIPRDRDKALISSSGFLPGLIRPSNKMLVAFSATYPPVTKLTVNSTLSDQRLLNGLEKPVWDSIAAAVKGRITDSVIADAVAGPAAGIPIHRAGTHPQAAHPPRLAAIGGEPILSLPRGCRRHPCHRCCRPRHHHACRCRTTSRFACSRVPIEPYYRRVFDARETREIRVYLHGGDDRAVVLGDVARSIPIRVIGGNGTNVLVDSSRVGGRRNSAHLYDAGTVTNVSYGPDTLFNRRPQLHVPGGPVDPIRDYGSQSGPTAGRIHQPRHWHHAAAGILPIRLCIRSLSVFQHDRARRALFIQTGSVQAPGQHRQSPREFCGPLHDAGADVAT